MSAVSRSLDIWALILLILPSVNSVLYCRALQVCCQGESPRAFRHPGGASNLVSLKLFLLFICSRPTLERLPAIRWYHPGCGVCRPFSHTCQTKSCWLVGCTHYLRDSGCKAGAADFIPVLMRKPKMWMSVQQVVFKSVCVFHRMHACV